MIENVLLTFLSVVSGILLYCCIPRLSSYNFVGELTGPLSVYNVPLKAIISSTDTCLVINLEL